MKLSLTFLFFILISLSSYSQHIKINKKKLAFLKTEKAMNIVFNYDNHTRGGNHISELEYIKKRKKRLVVREKDPEVWYTNYKNSKDIHWKDAFLNQLNKSLYKHKAPEFLLYSDIKTNFTMKVNVLWIYSGYDIGIAKSAAKLTLKIELFDNNTNQIIETIHIKKAYGENTDHDNESKFPNLRLVQNAFKTAGFKLAITLQRVFNKK
ncbi:MAG: hypothetical protein HRT69_00120 [Flavobacteriaceae bacterium]|nr:hypothetical protein [Flavobacteriaceae bacterium]